MPIVILAKEEFTGKDKREWVKLSGIDEKGRTMDNLFFSKADYDAFEIPDGAIAKLEQLKEMFDKLPVVSVVFGQRGRVEKINI